MKRYSPTHGFGEYEEDSLGSLVLFKDAHALELALAAERTRREEAEKLIADAQELIPSDESTDIWHRSVDEYQERNK